MRILLPLLTAATMLGCSSKPLTLSQTDNDVAFGDLIKIENSKIDLVLLSEMLISKSTMLSTSLK